jgi:hypothetical protein
MKIVGKIFVLVLICGVAFIGVRETTGIIQVMIGLIAIISAFVISNTSWGNSKPKIKDDK